MPCGGSSYNVFNLEILKSSESAQIKKGTNWHLHNRTKSRRNLFAAALCDIPKDLLGEIGGPDLANDSYFDLPGIGKAFLDFLHDVTSKSHGR